MYRINKFPIVFFLLALLSFESNGQSDTNYIFRAMKDELNRSISDLQYGNFDKPFFIAYQVDDYKNLNIAASLGSILRTAEFPGRSNYVRVLAGGYDFNDESLDNDITSPERVNLISMPVDDDYYGIRRALWSHTNNIYFDASAHFNRNKLDLSERNKSLSEIPHRSFAKTEPHTLVLPVPEISYNIKNLEQYVKQLSAVFLKYDSLSESAVMLSFLHGTRYILNSEGVEIIVPFSNMVLTCEAGIKCSDGERLFGKIEKFASIPAGLPSLDIVKTELDSIAQLLVKNSKANVMEEDYSGPVLFTGDAVSALYKEGLFTPGDGLSETNEINTGSGEQIDAGYFSDAKIGKVVVSELVSVKAIPALKKFGKTDLVGSFMADNEGVIPPDELTLIDHGVLKNLLNDRTITKPGQTANGHGEGPGVIQVAADKTLSLIDLKKLLIDKAKDDGQKYAYIVKSINAGEGRGGSYGTFDVYRISVSTGAENFVRSAKLNSIDGKIFKKLIAASNDTVVLQVQNGFTGNNRVVSFLTPSALLFKQMDINVAETSFSKEDIFVENPLTAAKKKK